MRSRLTYVKRARAHYSIVFTDLAQRRYVSSLCLSTDHRGFKHGSQTADAPMHVAFFARWSCLLRRRP